MYSDYYADYEVFTDNIRRVLATELAPRLAEWERDGSFPDEVFSILGRNGFLGILIPEEFGGVGGDYKLAGAWCEAFGELCAVGLTTGVNMHSLVVMHALEKLGSQEAKAKWLPSAVRGESIGAYAFTEPGHGSDLANLRTKATRQGDNWILDGAKTFITNGARADFILVLARTDFNAGYKGFTTFVVDTSLPGFKVAKKLDKLGWRSSDTAELVFEGLTLDSTCILGKEGEGWVQAANSLNWERMMLTLTSLGGARAAFKEALAYARVRNAFGKQLFEIDAVREMLVQMYRKIVSSQAICHHALDLLLEGKNCKAEVSVAKRHVCEDAVWVADRAIQIHGGYGYTTEFQAERWWRDLRLMPIGGGTSEIMANIVVKELGL